MIIEFQQSIEYKNKIEDIIINHDEAGELLRVTVTLNSSGDMIVEIFDSMNEGESIYVNEFMIEK